MNKEVKWTFITDALPVKETRYFVTTPSGEVKLASWRAYEYEGRCYGGEWIDCFVYGDEYDQIEVVAWMPFVWPEPYKPEEDII